MSDNIPQNQNVHVRALVKLLNDNAFLSYFAQDSSAISVKNDIYII
jgi:hypothetical protein